MRHVVVALILREARTRYGRNRLGYTWALVEPMLQVSVLALIWSMLGRTSHSGIEMVPLIISGVVCFQAFTQIVGRMAGALNANRSLLQYPPVRPADPLIARALLEIFTSLIVLGLLLGGALLLGYSVPLESPVLAMWAFLCGSVFATGYGFALSAASRVTAVADRVSAFVNRGLFYTSGVFFTLEMLPGPVADAMSWMPLAQVIEVLRAGLFPGAGLRYADPLYLGWCALIALGFGLVIHRLVERLPTYRLSGFGGVA